MLFVSALRLIAVGMMAAGVGMLAYALAVGVRRLATGRADEPERRS